MGGRRLRTVWSVSAYASMRGLAAADGSLWLWPDRERYEESTLLKLPKQPQPLGNVFSKPD